MSSYKLQLNIDGITAASEKAFTDTAFLFSRELTRVITEPRTWNGFDAPRDIVDLGQLRSSQQLVFIKPMEAVYSWPVEYAALVHEGYTLRNGQRMEGRPWTTIAQQEFDVRSTYLRFYQQRLEEI